MKKYVYLFLIALSTISLSQVTEEWVRRYNGPANNSDEASSLAIDISGSVYVTGVSYSSTSDYDYCTIKYNSLGVQQWAQRYNGTGNYSDAATAIAVDNSGNVYVTGQSVGSGTDFDYCTVKYNSSGIQQWTRRYNGPGNYTDAAKSISIDNSGNVCVTGSSQGSGTSYDYCTIKYNSSGVQQWVQRYDGPVNGIDYAYSIAADNSGNVYVTGMSLGSGTDFDYCTVKYNSSGIQQWARRYNGPGNSTDGAFSIAVDDLGNVYVTGQCNGSGTGYDYCTIKYNLSGVQQWVERYNGPGNYTDVANSIALDNSANVYVTGKSQGSGTGFDYCTIKYSSLGVPQWIRRYNGTGNGIDYAYAVAVDNGMNVYVTGQSYDNVSYNDYCTVKYNPSGVQQWVQRYNGPEQSNDQANCIAVDNSQNVYVTGTSYGGSTMNDYASIKYSQNIGIKRISSEIPEEYELSQNYPNPFNPSTKIKFYIPLSPLSEMSTTRLVEGVGGFVILKIYDLLGREVATLVNEQLQPGTYEVEFDGTNFPSGLYFYKLTARNVWSATDGSLNMTKKMVLLK